MIARACGSLLLLASALLGPSGALAAATPASVDFVHVTANVGTATGGHSALRLGGDTYHYEFHGDGLLRLDRVGWTDFLYQYGSLDNRDLHVASLPVSDATLRQVTSRFSRLLVVQQRHLDRLDALDLEARWHEARAGAGTTLPLRGVGLFHFQPGASGDSVAGALRASVVEALGAGFLREERRRVSRALRAEADAVSAPDAGDLAWDAYAEPDELQAERRRDQLLLREALAILDEARPLAAEAVLDLAEVAPEEAARGLTESEREELARLARAVEASVVRLVASDRPDRGQALLVAMARHRALLRSLEAGRLLVLDPLPADAVVLDEEGVARREDTLRRLAEQRRRDYLELRVAALSGNRGEEVSLRLLEHAVSRYYEAQGGAAVGRAVRGSPHPNLLPARVGQTVVQPAVESAGSESQASAARRNVSGQRQRLRTLYGYGLFRHNCATELVRSLYSAFPDEETARRELGGLLEPGDGLGFVPAGLARQVELDLPVRETAELPSFRTQKLAEMLDHEHPTAVHLRESNTLTSSLYHATEADGRFLFFTEEAPLLRPLLGALNLGYAAGHAVVGLLALPFDRGRRVVEGLHGVVFSVPELFFVNIRKGTFEFVPREDP